jgi:hypothetical protein
MKETSEIVLHTFQKSCEEHAKLFLPEPRQAEILDSLVNYYNKYYSIDILNQCVVEFVKTSDDPILVYNFALDSSKIRDRIVDRLKSKAEFSKLVRETEERMRQFDEL